MASSDSSYSLSHSSVSSSDDEINSEEDYGIVNLQANAPYQDELLAIPGQPVFRFEEDPEGIPHETLAARHEGIVKLEDW